MNDSKRYLFQWRTSGFVYGQRYFGSKKEAIEACKKVGSGNVIDTKTSKKVYPK